jgi:prepilin-type N-terminal cleavage/methylation domain-containing protein
VNGQETGTRRQERGRCKVCSGLTLDPLAPAFTLIELLVVVAVIAVLVAILIPCLNRAREAGRRAACMGHLHRIQTGWHMYATDYADFIVNGQCELDFQVHNPGTPWLMKGYSYPFPQSANEGQALMRTGSLACYVGDARTYMCPSRYRHTSYLEDHGSEWLSSYHAMPSMNRFPPELWLPIDSQARASHQIGGTSLFVRKTSELGYPSAASRMVFMDLGTYGTEHAWGGGLVNFAAAITEGSTGGIYEEWFLATHHAGGTCASFADGHVERWRWMNTGTVAVGRLMARIYILGEHDVPKSPGWDGSPNNSDALRLNKAIWGRWPLPPYSATNGAH